MRRNLINVTRSAKSVCSVLQLWVASTYYYYYYRNYYYDDDHVLIASISTYPHQCKMPYRLIHTCLKCVQTMLTDNERKKYEFYIPLHRKRKTKRKNAFDQPSCMMNAFLFCFDPDGYTKLMSSLIYIYTHTHVSCKQQQQCWKQPTPRKTYFYFVVHSTPEKKFKTNNFLNSSTIAKHQQQQQQTQQQRKNIYEN